MKENDVKVIVAKFLRINSDSINDETIVDSSVLKGSVLFHRMISRINDICNVEIKDYSSIRTYSNIIEAIKNSR
jgi:hypothetical protein